MRTYLFVLEVETMQVGAVYKSLPLHCTLMHWFNASITPEDLIKKVTSVFKDRSPIELVSDAPAMFGKNNNIPVHTVIMTQTLQELHEELFSALNNLGAKHNEPAFVGSGFHPHVTTHGEQSFPPESRIVTRNAYLVEALNKERLIKKIVAQIKFK